MMSAMRYLLAVGMVSVVPLAIADEGVPRLNLEVRDMVVGEFSMGGADLIRVSIENSGSLPVKMGTSSLISWLSAKPWRVHVEGPRDSRCEKYEVHGSSNPAPGETPYVEIPPHGRLVYTVPLVGVAEPGEYRVWVEYDGTIVPEGLFHERVRTAERAFRIKEAGGEDLEVVRFWREKNPDRPICLFPSDSLTNDKILADHPTSIYAGWALWDRIRNHKGGFSGAPSEAEPARFLQAVKNPDSTVLYSEQFGSRSAGNVRLIEKEKAAEWRESMIRPFLKAHPDFVYADELRLRLVMDLLASGKSKEASAEAGELVQAFPNSIAATRASAYVEHTRRTAQP